MTKKEKTHQEIIRHGENLNAIFKTGLDPVILCKKLRRLENTAHKMTLDWCNGEINDEISNKEEVKILNSVDKLLHFRQQNIPVTLNMDARGYALVIPERYMYKNKIKLFTNMGGVGVLAPDFN